MYRVDHGSRRASIFPSRDAITAQQDRDDQTVPASSW